MTETLYGIVEDAKYDLRQWAEDNPDDWDADSHIGDTCDAATPVYDADLIRLALENGELRPSNWVTPIANAVYDAAGIRLRTIPFTQERVKSALSSKAS